MRRSRAVRFQAPPIAESRGDLRRTSERLSSRFLVPWPPSTTLELARRLWPYLAMVVNEPLSTEPATEIRVVSDGEGRPVRRIAVSGRVPSFPAAKLRADLSAIESGGAARVNGPIRVPFKLVAGAGLVHWQLAEPLWLHSPRAMRIYDFVLMLLASDVVRPRLRRCAACANFALLSRAKSRNRRHFCDDDCRHAWEHSPEGRREGARRVREHYYAPAGRRRT